MGDGEFDEDNCRYYAETCLVASELVQITGKVEGGAEPSGEILVLKLAPGTRVRPYTASDNHMLTAHMPLANIAGLRLRVGNDTRQYPTERMLIFDDSFETELVNEGEDEAYLL